MYINDDIAIILKISEVFDKNVIIANGKITINDEATVRGLLDFIQTSPSFVILDEDAPVVSSIEERNLLFRRLNWFFSKILLLVVHDESTRYTKRIRPLLEKMMQRSLNSFMYWYKNFIDLQINILNSSIKHDLSKGPIEINIPGHEMEGNLNFWKITIRTEAQINNLISFTFQTLTRAIALFPSCMKAVNIRVQDMLTQVFMYRQLECKTAVLLFCSSYYENVHSIEFIDASIKIFHFLSTIYENLSEYIDTGFIYPEYFVQIFLESFLKYLEMFISHFKLACKLLDTMTTDFLIASVIRLVFFESKWIERYKIPPLTHCLIEIVDAIFLAIDYDESIIKHIDIVKPLSFKNNNMLLILKYKIILELENAENFDQKVRHMSPTWSQIQTDLALKTNFLLNNQHLPNKEFLDELQWINDAIKITFDINFHFTRRHQTSHCLNYVCKYEDCRKLDNPDRLFSFNDWDYDHIYLDFFDDLPSITHKLTLTISRRNEFTTDILLVLINLCSFILQIPSTASIKEDKRLYLLATTISPFIISFNNFDNVNKSAEFKKLQTFLNFNIRKLVKDNLSDVATINELKIVAINAITKLKFNKLGKSFEWLNFNLMQLIFKKEEKPIKKVYANKFLNLLMSNFETMSTFLLHYQNIRLNNTKLELEELRNILCLHDKNVVICKTILSDYYVYCSSCKPDIPCDNENSKELRWQAFITDKKVCIISADFIDKKEVKIQIQPNLFKDQEPSFYAEFIKNIPACMKHSKNFMDFCQKDDFFEIIFQKHENVLGQTDYYFEKIIKSIQKSGLDEEVKTAFFEKLLDNLFNLTTFYSQKSDVMKCQFHIVNMIATFGMTVRNNVATYGNKFIADIERVTLKCLKLLIYFIILKQSEVKGVAVNSMFRMLEYNGMVLHTFINWYKTTLIEQITKLCLVNSLDDTNQSGFLSSLINTLKHFNYQDIYRFIRTNISSLITSIFVFCIHNNKMNYIYSLIDQSGYNVRKTLELSSLTLYEKIYGLDKHKKANCLNYIHKEMRITFKELFQINRREIVQNVLIKYNSNPQFVIDVIKQMGDENLNLTDDDHIANYISRDFLGPLNNFERILNSGESERALKQSVLLSLGDLIRFLGGRRISNLCFKIMSLLRSTNKTNEKLKEVSLSVWKILIFNCDISTLGPFLSQILVALESFIDEFSTEVEEICIYLIFENSNLLSTHISDLFFIEKTNFDIAIKNAVLNQIESQRVADGNDFDINLNLMIRHLKNEHADSNVKIYCLQYLEEFIKKNRKKFNNLIFASVEMNVSIKYLLDVLTSCSKSFHNKNLQIQTAKCFGELGALKPSLNKQNFLSQKVPENEMTIHSDSFAIKLLTVYCNYYKDMKETRHMESMALAIQGILRERTVNEKHSIWKALPEFTRELFRPLLTSTYVPRNFLLPKYETIFWNQAQTPTSWAFLFSGLLVGSINVEETRSLLLNLLPSMRENQEICSILLPRIILHYLQSNISKEHDESIYQEFDFIFRMVLDSTICADASKDELNYKFVASYDYTPIERKETEENQNKVLSVSIKTTKMIFDVWDFLTRYQQITDNPEVVERIGELFNRFEKRKLAEVNYKCGEYERAMILFESFIKTMNKNQRESELPFLVNIYAKLRDSDLIEGVKAMRLTEWSFSDRILISEITGNLEGTFSYIDMMMKESDFKQDQIQTIINCYIKSNQNSTALLVADQLLEKLYESNKEHPYCDEIKAEALWRLSKFDEFDALLNSDRIGDRNNWNVVCGKLLTKFRLEDTTDFWKDLESARLSVMHNFKISDSDEAIYQDNYNEIFHLHILSEFEKFQIAFEDIQNNTAIGSTMKILKSLIKELDSRKLLLQTTTHIIESSLSLRRGLLLQLEKKLARFFNDNEYTQISSFIGEEVGKTWIECVKITCKQKMFAQAHAFMMEADFYKPQELFIEKAKYYWMKDEKTSALRILELNCSELEKQCKSSKKSKSDFKEKMLLLSRGRLNIARYNAEVKNVDFDMNKKLYKDALLEDSFDIQSTQNEEIYVLLADYMDRHYFSKCKSSNELPAYEKLLEIMEAYGSSMKYGVNYVLQAMPRFLEIWFNAMTSLERKSTNSKIKTRDDEEIEQRINNYVKSVVKVLKPYYFYTAFSQLISRLCHPSHGVYSVLKMIITKLIEEYPLESMWFIMPNASSKSDFRKKRTNEILNGFSKERVRFAQFNGFMEKIMSLAQRKHADSEFMGVLCSSIEKLLKHVTILMPLQKHLQCVQATADNSLTIFNSQVLISRIDKNIEVMRSLQQPKKITFVGSDGKEYPMLLKFKDDLRIDFRFMEFLKVINDYFSKDADASQRCLSARTYSVIPWNEDMGIIEWVPNIVTFKSVLNEQYKKSKIKVPPVPELKKMSDAWIESKNKKQFFYDMKKRFPPILGRWYLEHFTNVQSYFSARQNYIRSVAVMSMVGYVMGLGDRHLENILIDIHSGEVVHVDFACVFNKGETLGYPETVPFRLTQTMIEAMGPLGIEGPFRKCCEVALQLMQKEKNTLISYLRPFIYDPMIRKKASDQGETIDSAAMVNLENVDKKLKGIVKKYKGSSGIALSSEGQVKFIIEEATSDDNLAIMWFHWNPYI